MNINIIAIGTVVAISVAVILLTHISREKDIRKEEDYFLNTLRAKDAEIIALKVRNYHLENELNRVNNEITFRNDSEVAQGAYTSNFDIDLTRRKNTKGDDIDFGNF